MAWSTDGSNTAQSTLHVTNTALFSHRITQQPYATVFYSIIRAKTNLRRSLSALRVGLVSVCFCFQLKHHRLLHRIFASCCICLPCKLSCMSAIVSRNCVAIVPFPFCHPTLATGVSSPFFFFLHGTSTSSSSPSLSLSATLLDKGLECSGVSASSGSSPTTFLDITLVLGLGVKESSTAPGPKDG